MPSRVLKMHDFEIICPKGVCVWRRWGCTRRTPPAFGPVRDRQKGKTMKVLIHILTCNPSIKITAAKVLLRYIYLRFVYAEVLLRYISSLCLRLIAHLLTVNNAISQEITHIAPRTFGSGELKTDFYRT